MAKGYSSITDLIRSDARLERLDIFDGYNEPFSVEHKKIIPVSEDTLSMDGKTCLLKAMLVNDSEKDTKNATGSVATFICTKKSRGAGWIMHLVEIEHDDDEYKD